MRVAGVMSGTSLDGIDVAIVDIDDRRGRLTLSVAGQRTVSYAKSAREAILAVSNAETHTGTLARLHFVLGELYAEAIEKTCDKTGVSLGSVELIGCHGQTVFHDGKGTKFLGRKIATTLQIGDGAVVAERTGIPVVSDFRTRDIAAGGQGAPLVPYVDYELFRDRRRGRVALNIGGIANITAIPPNADVDDVLAFDTGPGNMVIDALVSQVTNGKRRFDRHGRIAASGKVNQRLLELLLRDRYYRRRPPKSAGREQYGKEFVARLMQSGMKNEDLVATATALTAAAIAVGVDRFVRPIMPIHDLIVSGGGVHNPQLMTHLGSFLPGTAICTSAEFGVDADSKEAIAFAVLAYRTWRRKPANVPSATGARRPVVLGKLNW